MHCSSCNILMKEKLSEIPNVHSVKPDHTSCKVEVTYTGRLEHHTINTKIKKFGYQVVNKVHNEKEPYIKRITDFSVLTIILFILYYFAQELRILPEFNTSVGSGLTFISVFILGLIASTSTCMATSGALFLSTVGKIKNGVSLSENIIPAVSFNIGRILSYGIFGFLIGLLGKAAAESFVLGPFMTFVIGILMILIGLNMAGIISFDFLSRLSLTSALFEKIESRLIKYPKRTAFLLGASTYLLPCGFTQSVQIYALGLANPVQSALIMMIFAVGTSPALLALAFASNFARSNYYLTFSKIAGVLLFMIGISYFLNFLSLKGVSLATTISESSVQNVREKNGVQEAYMSVDASGYSPNVFTIKQGIPVKWIVDGQNVFGCQGFIQAPKLGIRKSLELGENIFQFTPQEKGQITFSCSMGMYRGIFNVI